MSRRVLPTPGVAKEPEVTSSPSEMTAVDFIKNISARSEQGSEISMEDIQRFQRIISGTPQSSERAQQLRSLMEGDEITSKMLNGMSNKKNAHGGQMPSRKKVLKAQKAAKKASKLTSESQKNYKAVIITRSRKYKEMTVKAGIEVKSACESLSVNYDSVPQTWGDLVVVSKPKCGHMRNKEIERIFNREAMFGDEVVVLIPGRDLSIEEMKKLAKEATKPSIYIEPEEESVFPDGVITGSDEESEKQESPEGCTEESEKQESPEGCTEESEKQESPEGSEKEELEEEISLNIEGEHVTIGETVNN